MSIYAKLGLDTPQQMPPVPEAALLLGGLFHRLGGSFHIDENGKRQMMMPCAGAYEGDGWDRFPHPVPNARPTERFINGDQFEGALRMIVALMDRLHPKDRSFLYDVFANAMTQVDLDRAEEV